MKRSKATVTILASAMLMLGGCATRPTPFDYSAFAKAKPASLLILPPLNDSPDVKASSGVWSHATLPLAEAGYYVIPVTLVDETLRQNGINSPNEAQDIPYQKLRDFFGADAGVYIKVRKYGTSYAIIASDTRVEADAKIIDLRTGTLLWQGSAVASSSEQQQSQGSLAGILIAALVNQIVGTATDAAYNYAGIASGRMLGEATYNGVLAGPRSPNFGKLPPAK